MGRMRATPAAAASAGLGAYLRRVAEMAIMIGKQKNAPPPTEEELDKEDKRNERRRWRSQAMSAYEIQQRSRQRQRARQTHPGKRGRT